jgi:hypothetical protein
VTTRRRFQATTMAAKVPKVATMGMSVRDVSVNATHVVAVVTNIARKDRLSVHAKRPAAEPETTSGCARDCFHASRKTKTSSALQQKRI